MRINDVFCDCCGNKTGYGVDWLIPNFIEDRTRKIYELFCSWGFRDFCEPCFDKIRNDISNYGVTLIRDLKAANEYKDND